METLYTANSEQRGGHYNIKEPFYQYMNSYYKDKTVSQLSYLYNGIP